MSDLPFKQRFKNYSLLIYYRIKEILRPCCCCFNIQSELENNYELDEIIIVNNDNSIENLEPGKRYNKFKYIKSYSSEEVIYDRDNNLQNNIQNKNNYNSIKNDNKNDGIEKNIDYSIKKTKSKIPIKNKNRKKNYRKNAKRIRNNILNAKKIKKAKYEKMELELNDTEKLVDSNNNFLNYKENNNFNNIIDTNNIDNIDNVDNTNDINDTNDINNIIDKTITNENFESANEKTEDEWELLQ